MTLELKLLGLASSKNEIANAMDNINHHVAMTFRECVQFCYDPNLTYIKLFSTKIESILDYLHDELNTGHWSEVPLYLRQAFTAASLLKAVIVIKSNKDVSVQGMQEALKAVDMGLLLGAPLSVNAELLMQCASVLSLQIQEKLKTEIQAKCSKVVGVKRKLSDELENTFDNLEAKLVDCISCPSLEFFNKTYYVPEVPVKLEGCMQHWPAMTKWMDINYLLKIAGDRTVPIELGSHYADENWSQKLMTLREFITTHFLENPQQNIGYLAQHNLFDQILELKDDISIPEYCALSRNYEEVCEPDINAWLGPKSTVSPLHFDPKDNLLAQVFGTKQVLLFAPTDSKCLYPHDDRLLFNTACVNPMQPDLTKFPEYSKASMYKSLLQPGEILFIPQKWWHHVTAFDKSFSVSFWWK